MYSLSFDKINVLLLAVRTSTVATALKKVTMITSTRNLPLSSVLLENCSFSVFKNKLDCDFLYWKNLSLVCPLRNHVTSFSSRQPLSPCKDGEHKDYIQVQKAK